ncbi:MAG: hypothetical protein WKG32_10525 [Gemmatimonadaceae bacterium]
MTPRWEERPGGLPSGAVETGDGGGHDGHGDQGGGGAPQRLVAGLALVATGLLGVVGGIALDRTALDRRPSFGGDRSRRPPYSAPSPDEGRRRLGDRMRADLGLTERQARAIDSIVSGQFREIEAARSAMEPRIRAIVEATRGRIDSVLTPQQREQFRARREMESREHEKGGRGMRGREMRGREMGGRSRDGFDGRGPRHDGGPRRGRGREP